ncbi:GNAT family N-acetyltransferase [Alteromonas sp. CYL-A6]|uniref:GNAT family N-acetyltransferase n=1 Tax=Alteromonas nitratireducens TaxID=3390813 RepID=UPI0034B2EEF6
MAFHIENVDWKSGQHRLKQLREKVFVIEWHLPQEAEFDEHDSSAYHVLISDEKNQPIATGRLTRDGDIGRIAVSHRYRNLAMYKKLFGALVAIARKQNVAELKVTCDLDSVRYHSTLGFSPCGPVFMEAGIPRQRMACSSQAFVLPDVEHLH